MRTTPQLVGHTHWLPWQRRLPSNWATNSGLYDHTLNF